MWWRRTERRPSAQPRRAARVLGLALAALSAALVGCTSTVGGNLRETYEVIETGDQKSTNVSTLLEASAEGSLGRDLEYRLGERVIASDLSLEQGGASSDDTQLIHQPSVETVLTSGPLRWTQGLEIQDSRTTSTGAQDVDRLRTWLFEEVDWRPADWPRLLARVDRRTEQDDLTTDREEIYTVWQVDDQRGPFEWLYALETLTITDDQANAERDGLEHRVRASWRDDFADGRLFTSLTFNGRTRRDTSQVGGGLGLPSGEVDPVAGLSVVDTTPDLAVLAVTPGLIDDDETTPTAINIGGFASGGQNSWNIGVDLGGMETVDKVLLTTDAVVPLFQVNQFSFSVWTSNDNSSWSLVQGSAPTTYDQFNRRFEISFAPTTGLYLKVVNNASPPGAGPVFVTEMRVFDSSSTAPSGPEDEREFYEVGVRSSTSWRATDDLTLTWDVLAQLAGADDNGQEVRDEERLDNTLTALWAAHDQVDVSVRAENREIHDSVGPDESTSVLGGVVDYRPLDTLDIGVGYTWSEREFSPTGTFRSKGWQVRSSARLLEDLEAEVSFEQVSQDDGGQDIQTDRDIFSAGLVARVTPRLDMTLGYSNDEASQSGGGAPVAADPSSENWELLTLWRATDQLNAEVRLIWRDTPAGDGLDENYRLDWLPFPGGDLNVQLDLLRRVDGFNELSTDQLSLLVQWMINAKARLTFNYGALVPEDAERTDLFTVVLNLSY